MAALALQCSLSVCLISKSRPSLRPGLEVTSRLDCPTISHVLEASSRSRKGLHIVNQRQRRHKFRVFCNTEPFKDTRIHYGSSTEGWIGGQPARPAMPAGDPDARNIEPAVSPYITLLMQAADTHYQYLGVTPDASEEEIKSAYRKLSKLYHPDTTKFPLEIASKQFLRLKEAHTVLSSVEKRRFYDWKLAQDVAKDQQARPLWKTDGLGERIGPSPVKKNGKMQYGGDGGKGGNIPLSDQASAALAFDFFAIIIALLAIVYALFFKNK